MSPKFLRPSAAEIARERQEPKQYIFAELMYPLPRRNLNRGAYGLESMSRGDTVKEIEVYICPDDIYVREFRLTR